MSRTADHKAQIREQGGDQEVIDAGDLYDSERLAINKVLAALSASSNQQHREMGAVQREVRERFAEIGFVVRCDFYEDTAEDHMNKEDRVQHPQITLIRRCEPTGEFDHEQMGHEVRSNIIGVKGQAKTQNTQVSPGWSRRDSGLMIKG